MKEGNVPEGMKELGVGDDEVPEVKEDGEPEDEVITEEPEITVEQPSEPEEVKEDGVKPEQPETPEEPEKPHLASENRRLREKIQKLESERKTAPVYVPPIQITSPYSPNDDSEQSERYWNKRESETGLSRHQLHSQEQETLRIFRGLEQDREYTENVVSQNVDKFIEENPHLESLRAEIERQIKSNKGVSNDTKKNYASIELMALKIANELQRKAPVHVEPKPKLPLKSSSTATPSQQAPAKSGPTVSITPAMMEFAQRTELWKPGEPYTQQTKELIFRMYNRRFPKKPEKK